MRISSLVYVAMLAVAGAAYADEVSNWLTVPEDTAALAIYLEAQPGPISLTVQDGTGDTVDAVNWKFVELPLVRQYRVPAGQYQLMFEGVPGSILADAKAGTVSFLNLTSDKFGGFDVTLKSSSFEPSKSMIVEAIGAIAGKAGYSEIEPRYFVPAKNALYFQIRGPGVKPPPE